MQGARDGRRRHREHVDRGAHLLQALLVLDAEPLLFIDDEQAEVLKLERLRENGVGPNDDIDLALGGLLQHLGLLLRGAEAGEHLDIDGEVGEALLEGLEVLEAKDRGGREDRDLLAILHSLEGGAHGDFGLAVANIAAEEAIHRLGRFHVALDVGDGGELVIGLSKVEGVFKLVLHVGVGREGRALGGFALGVELE